MKSIRTAKKQNTIIPCQLSKSRNCLPSFAGGIVGGGGVVEGEVGG